MQKNEVGKGMLSQFASHDYSLLTSRGRGKNKKCQVIVILRLELRSWVKCKMNTNNFN